MRFDGERYTSGYAVHRAVATVFMLLRWDMDMGFWEKRTVSLNDLCNHP
jgi:hypothetical protein